MDRQHRPGGKYGQGVMMSKTEEKQAQKYRQKRIAMESVDLSKDPYFFKNHVGTFECRLCLTLHLNESSYILHSQGKKHLESVRRHLEREEREKSQSVDIFKNNISIEKIQYIKIGIPEYKVVNETDLGEIISTKIEVNYQGIVNNEIPAYRICNPFEQKMEKPDKDYLYLLIAANPYETICFKIPEVNIKHKNIDINPLWDKKNLIYTLVIYY